MTTDILLLPGQYYHIYNRGNNGANIFFEERNYRYFLKLYAHHIQPVAETFAYCLLRNHFHLLVRIKTDEERLTNQTGAVINQTGAVFNQTGAVSKTAPVSPILKPPHRHFNNFFIAYAKAINKGYQRTGSVFEKPFRRKLVENDRYFRQLVTYIHQNPQKHGFVDNFYDWPWSSYRTLTTTHSTQLRRDFVMDWFGSVDNFIEIHQTSVNEAGIEPLIEDDWL